MEQLSNTARAWYGLGIDNSSAMRPDFSWPATPPGTSSREFFYKDPGDVLSSHWLEMMAARGSGITSVILFYRAANSLSREAHIDVNARRYVTTCAINWAFGGRDSNMLWYETPEGVDPSSHDVTIATGKTHYLAFDASRLRLIDQCQVATRPVLVRTNIPHQIVVSDQDRWSVSMRFGGRYQAWDDAVSDFARTGHLIPR